jgi:hypothetical protein
VEIWVAVISIGGAVFVAVVGFWLALRQDERRWLREKRADLYIDLLAEAHAEHTWITGELTAIEIGETADPDGTDAEAGQRAVAEFRQLDARVADTRMPDTQRALLGARMAAFATPEVRGLFNALTECFPLGIRRGQASGLKMKAGLAFGALESRIESELLVSQRTLLQRIRGNPR